MSVSYDLVCAAAPFLDVTFVGLERLPAPGEELFAQELGLSPGGAAITAVGAARLGLRTAVLWPVGRDLAGRYVADLLAADGVDWLGRSVERSAVTAIMPSDGDRAMATYCPPEEPAREEVERLDARAVVTGVDRTAPAPADAWVYAVTGYADAVRFTTDSLPPVDTCRALIVNEAEALRITGAPDAAEAAVELGRVTPTAVVTLGAGGAVEWQDGSLVHASGPSVDAVDTTGAGDLFSAAYVFADLSGLERDARLALATLYAGLSVRRATGTGGALRLEELEEEARSRGLTIPRPVSTMET
jgi:sugar/nucleoside kinase (ribokinase family)